MDSHISKIYKNSKTAMLNIDELVQKLIEIFNTKANPFIIKINGLCKTVNELMDKLEKFIRPLSSTEEQFECIDIIFNIIRSFKVIFKYLKNVLDKTKNVETFLSQTYINETLMFHKKIKKLFEILQKDNSTQVDAIILFITNELNLNTEEYLKKYVKNIQDLFRKYPSTIDLYSQLITHILHSLNEWLPGNNQIRFYIHKMIEEDKTFILETPYLKNPPNPKRNIMNPYYNTFGLVPATISHDISAISQLIFKVECKNISDFIKLCKSKDYSLLVINKKINNPILYNVVDLLNWEKSMDFSKTYKPTYGVNKSILDRYKTIDKSKLKSKWNFEIDSYGLKLNSYDTEKDKFMIVLDTLEENKYRILVKSWPASNYFIRISIMPELYRFCSDSSIKATRICNYNKIQTEIAMENMFCPIKLDLDIAKENANIVDSKYLRNQIYLTLLDHFRDIINKKYSGGERIKDNYTYALIIHNDDFLSIFSNIITNEFHKYIYENYDEFFIGPTGIIEIFSSYIGVVYIYQRTFVKEMHDYFKDNPFNFEERNKVDILQHFDAMILSVLEKIITNESNIYQTILYKINSLKTTLI